MVPSSFQTSSSSSSPPTQPTRPTQYRQQGGHQVEDDTAGYRTAEMNADSQDVVVVADAAAAIDPDERHPAHYHRQTIVDSNSGQKRFGSDGMRKSAVASVGETPPSCYYQHIVTAAVAAAAAVEGEASFETPWG